MTKSLTEKWKDGSFEFGVYYCKTKEDGILKLELCHEGDGHGYAYCYGEEECYRYEDIEEVLAPVPSYDEFKQLVSKTDKLEKKLEIAKKALKKYAESDNWFEEDTHGEVWSFQKESKHPWRIGFKALKEMEGAK